MAERIHTILQVPQLVLFVFVYACSMLGLWFMNRREFKRCPEKGTRYQALPVVYKLACWLIVMPLFAGILFEGALFIPATVAFMLLEVASVRWYRKAGLFP